MLTATVALAFVHHLAAFVIMGALMVELVVLRNDLTVASARSVLRMDMAYGIAATTILVVGFLRVFYTEKSAAYYFHSGTFLAKIALFVIVGLLSIYPTMTFMRWRPALAQGQVPAFDPERRRRVRMLLHIQLTLLTLIILLAVMMARLIGFLG